MMGFSSLPDRTRWRTVLRVERFADPMTTNVCFGGAGLDKAYVTLSGTGQLVELDWTGPEWSTPGLALAFSR